ncbi:hypothetical protein PCASD_19629 [Puccinia coronata f. sp. avenae]|uniref:Uncharacterized protein n=1 Tax=Puccinia coronata f. sp. avenae TaxID=200324 RepID=A0A2N5TTT6_9BASI|nr:hypothetical protein PCASD_19629 [Puccinia coronata f. sp. avenae]
MLVIWHRPKVAAETAKASQDAAKLMKKLLPWMPAPRIARKVISVPTNRRTPLDHSQIEISNHARAIFAEETIGFTRKLLRNAPMDFLGGILVHSIVLTKSISDSSPTSQPPNKNAMQEKPAFSIPTTTLNFKNFVSKCGPIFAAQVGPSTSFTPDAVNKIISLVIMMSLFPGTSIGGSGRDFQLAQSLQNYGLCMYVGVAIYPNGMGDDLGVDSTSGKHVFDDPVKRSPDPSYSLATNSHDTATWQI